MRIHPLFAVGALAARGDARNQNVVARLKTRHARAHAFHDANAFVPQNATGNNRRHIAFENVQIGATNRGARHLDDGIGGRFDFRARPLFQRKLTGAMIDKGFHTGSFP